MFGKRFKKLFDSSAVGSTHFRQEIIGRIVLKILGRLLRWAGRTAAAQGWLCLRLFFSVFVTHVLSTVFPALSSFLRQRFIQVQQDPGDDRIAGQFTFVQVVRNH